MPPDVIGGRTLLTACPTSVWAPLLLSNRKSMFQSLWQPAVASKMGVFCGVWKRTDSLGRIHFSLSSSVHLRNESWSSSIYPEPRCDLEDRSHVLRKGRAEGVGK